MHIAVLEDEKSLAIDLATLLKKNGHEVSIFGDGLHLIETLQGELYDMFILDWVQAFNMALITNKRRLP